MDQNGSKWIENCTKKNNNLLKLIRNWSKFQNIKFKNGENTINIRTRITAQVLQIINSPKLTKKMNDKRLNLSNKNPTSAISLLSALASIKSTTKSKPPRPQHQTPPHNTTHPRHPRPSSPLKR